MTKNIILASSLLGAVALCLFIFLVGDFPRPAKSWANLSAHLAFYYFFITFAARPAHNIFANALTLKWLRYRRYTGLGFAVTHSFHLVALVYFFVVSKESPNALSVVGGGLAYTVMFMMALTSNNKMVHKLGHRRWKMLHSTGMHYFALIFLVTFSLRFFEKSLDPLYGIYTFLLVGVYAARLIQLRRL